MPYDLELAKQLTGITDESVLKFYIQAIIDQINSILGYNILKHDLTEIIVGIDKNYVYTTARPINSITEVKHFEADITDKCFIIPQRRIGLPYVICNQHDVKVTYNAGYETLPTGIQAFIFSQVSQLVNDMENQGLKSYSIETISYSFVEKQTQQAGFINQVRNLFGGV